MTPVMIHTLKYMTTVMMVQGPTPIGTEPSAPDPWAAEVTLRWAAPSNTEAALAMLTRCSQASLFHRFHGFTDGVAYTHALFRDQMAGDTLVAWHRSRCVGLATACVGSDRIADLGILVEDAWQRQGIGTRLLRSLLEKARAVGVTTVHADVLGDDRFIVQALRRIGPASVSVHCGTFSVDMDLGTAGGRTFYPADEGAQVMRGRL
jgi:GNAT superfamily N-acetyltransferase